MDGKRKRRSDAGVPRRSTTDDFLDRFADLEPAAQAEMLVVLLAIHRQARRGHRKAQAPSPTCPRCMTAPAGQAPMGLCDDCHEDQKREDAEQANETAESRCPPKE